MTARGIVTAALAASLSAAMAGAQPVRVSIATDGTQANGPSQSPSISETGRFIAFSSGASNLVARDTNGVSDVFVRDRDTDDDGIFDEPGAVLTERVSVSTSGAESNAPAESPSLSADGRYVVFVSSATNLVPGLDVPAAQVYRHDRLRHETILVSVTEAGVLPDGACWSPSISRDGRFVAFASAARNLVPVDPPAPVPITQRPAFVYLRDVELGTLTVVSKPLPPPTHFTTPHNDVSTTFSLGGPEISADGSLIAYTVVRSFVDYRHRDLSSVIGTASVYHLETGTLRPDVASGTVHGISDDGRVLALTTGRGYFGLPPPSAGFLDVAAARVDAVDVGGPVPPWPASVFVLAASGNGRLSVLAVRYLPPFTETHHATGLWVMNRSTLAVTRFSDASNPLSAMVSGDLDRDGRWLAFGLGASSILPADTNGVADVFVLDLDTQFDNDGDGLDDRWEQAVGLSTATGLGDDGPSGDPDRDGRTNLQEYQRGGHPHATTTQYFAEGAQSAFFATSFAIVNPGTATATVALRHVRGSQSVPGETVVVPARSRRTVEMRDLRGFVGAFGTVVESDAPVVVERTARWDASGYGGHAETAAPLSDRWYFAEGSTSSPFDLFYLLSNPSPTPVSATITYLRPNGLAPIVRVYAVPAESRTTIQVGSDDPALDGTDLAATILATGPIVAERAMYLNAPGGSLWRGGVAGGGVTAPSPTWYLPEGATGPFFDLFILLANPSSDAARVEATYLTSTGDTLTKAYTLEPWSRTTIWVDEEVFDGRGTALELADVSTILASTNGVAIVAERTMWWPGGGAAWEEGHSSAGIVEAGARWAIADGEEGGARDVRTYILVANTSDARAEVAITLLRENGATAGRSFTVQPRQRLTIPIRDAFGTSASDGRFGALLEGTGPGAAGLAVERATYWNAPGLVWAGGTSAVATRVP